MSSATDLLEEKLMAQKNGLKVLHGVLTILSPQFASIFSCTHFRQDILIASNYIIIIYFPPVALVDEFEHSFVLFG